jgi:hypothetical protein
VLFGGTATASADRLGERVVAQQGEPAERPQVAVVGSARVDASRRDALRGLSDVRPTEHGQRVDHGLGRLEVRERSDKDGRISIDPGRRQRGIDSLARPRPRRESAVRMR